jgi:hypothetical protein
MKNTRLPHDTFSTTPHMRQPPADKGISPGTTTVAPCLECIASALPAALPCLVTRRLSGARSAVLLRLGFRGEGAGRYNMWAAPAAPDRGCYLSVRTHSEPRDEPYMQSKR